MEGLGNRGQVRVPSPGIHPVCDLLFLRRPPSQRTQYPLIKEYTLNHNIKAIKGLYNLRYIHKLMGIGFSGCLSFLFLFLSCPCSWTYPGSQGVPCCSLLFCWLCCWGSQLMHSLLCPSETFFLHPFSLAATPSEAEQPRYLRMSALTMRRRRH